MSSRLFQPLKRLNLNYSLSVELKKKAVKLKIKFRNIRKFLTLLSEGVYSLLYTSQ